MQRRSDRHSLLSLTLAARSARRFIADDRDRIAVDELAGWSYFDGPGLETLRGRTILLATRKQLPAALALASLDGVARRILLATPDLTPHLSSIAAEAGVDCVVGDREAAGDFGRYPVLTFQPLPVRLPAGSGSDPTETEWVLFTSGTTGRPKMVAHTLASLSGPLDDGAAHPSGAVWSTFYDIRRYGGLQILLRALIGGGSMVLSDANEPGLDFLHRVAKHGVTHISGTPSHWRRALMLGAGSVIRPRYVRLSGEVADQALLDALRAAFPNADVAHAFASTEAGVAFDVRDGRAGFPASLLTGSKVDMRIAEGTLWIRSSRNASRYLGQQPLRQSEDGFIDTGDLVEQVGDRFYFRGRKEGVINVGGLKVYPEEVEAVLTAQPFVKQARVWPRKNPITGSIVAADVVIAEGAEWDCVRSQLYAACAVLEPHKRPLTVRQVNEIALTPSGKVARNA
jgi:acyl-coenzyme A synthetase/AMP-(fatty) acid ligase